MVAILQAILLFGLGILIAWIVYRYKIKKIK